MNPLPLIPRSSPDRIERVALRPGLDSTRAVSAVGGLGEGARIIAVRDDQGWRRSRGPWTRSSVELLRVDTVREVLVRRRFRHARILLAWLPARAAQS